MLLKSNQNIENYLSFYCNDIESPKFAIMIKGKWGSGKTWFIKRFIKNNNESRFLYISLYGLKSTQEIDDQIFEKLHPILTSKPAILLGKVVKSAIRLGFKISLDDDNSISTETSIPNISPTDFASRLSNQIIVFDDLERNNLKIDNLLGYINTFVEHHGLKVIIIGNEDEIKNKYKKAFNKSKEKLISQSFEITPQIKEAYKSFINEITIKSLQKFFKINSGLAIEIFERVGYNNLRDVRQALINFEYIYKLTDKKFKKNGDFLKRFFQIFTYLSLEMKAGNLTKENWQDHLEIFFSHNLSFQAYNKLNEDKKKELVKELVYSKIFSDNASLLKIQWSDIIFDGKIDSILLNEGIEQSRFFPKNERTNLSIFLQEWRNISDDEFPILFHNLYEEFYVKKYSHPGDILHFLGLSLLFKKWGLIDKSRNEIKELVQKVIEELYNEKKLKYYNFIKFSHSSYNGHGFAESDSDEFKEVWEILKTKLRNVETDELKESANKEINNFPNTYLEFCNGLARIDGSGKYRNYPILAWIKADLFFENYINMNIWDRGVFIDALEDRYEKKYSNGVLDSIYLDELEFLRKLKELISEKIENSGVLFKPSILLLKGTLEELEKIIIFFETSINENRIKIEKI